MNEPKHPMQPLYKDERGHVRFKANKIVEYILDHAAELVHRGSPAIDPATGEGYHKDHLDLNKIVMHDFPQEDVEQFWQLMGYSLSGYAELSFISDETYETAAAAAQDLK